MKSLFTIHAGEYLVGCHIERNYRTWNVWLPSKDTGIDLLVTDSENQKTVSLQVKFSKDFVPTHGTPTEKDRLLASGWWTHDPKKIEGSVADFWIFVLPSFMEKQTSYIILPPAELLERFRAIPGIYNNKRIHSYFSVTKTQQCWEERLLSDADRNSIARDEFSDERRDLSAFLNAWDKIERKLNG